MLGAGCTQTKAVYVLNPDGSGKAKIQLIKPLFGPNRMLAGINDSNRNAREIASDIVSKSSGVLAWRDVEYRLLTLEQGDEMLMFEGVIYFMDIAEVKFHEQVVMYKLSLREDERGNSVLSLDFRPGKDKDEEAEDADGGEVPAVENITGQDVELRKRLKASRKRVGLRMMQALLEMHREEYVFKLPGPVLELTGLQEDDNRTVAFVCDGAELSDKLFDLHEKGDITFSMRSDTPDFLEQLKNLKVEEQLDEIEGITLHAEATFGKGAQPQFDFEKEVREAKGSQGEMFKKLGLEFRPLDTSGQDRDDDGFATAEEVQAGTEDKPWVYIEQKGGDKLVIKDFRKGEFEVKAGHQDSN